MKAKLSILLLYFLIILSGNSTLSAQVTIGLGEQPISGAILQMKDKPGVSDDAFNATKGVALPRVMLSQKKQLYPMFLTDPQSPYDPGTNPPTTEYTNNKAALDKSHTGLIVYNLVENDNEELCLGLNQWDGVQWNCFQQKARPALFEFDCGTLEVRGDYGDGIALNTSNYLRVQVTVTRIGAYSISAAFAPGNTLGDNGYFYELSGTFYTEGTFYVTIPGTGQPKQHTQGTDLLNTNDDTPDHFILTSSSGGQDCSFEVNVRSTAAHPEFAIDCGATVVEGMYFEDEPLTTAPNPINGQSHRIKVTLKNIPSTAYGAIAVLETNAVDGFSFKGEAVLSSSTQEIYLIGTGTPRGLNDKIFTITSNSESSTASCSVTVYMLIPPKRLMTFANRTGPLYSYNAGIVDNRNPPNNLNTLLTDKNNFGYNQWSILKFAGFTNVSASPFSNFITSPGSWSDDDRDIVSLDQTAWDSMSATTLESFLKGTGGHRKIDIFMIGYDVSFHRNSNASDLAKCQKLVEFIKTGGILMICSEETISNGNFMNLVFDNPSPVIGSATGAGPGENYTLGYNSFNTPADMRPYYCKDDDPILRGPFEDILGRNWGEDASTTRYLTNLPLDQVVVYSGARPMDYTGSTYPGNGVTIFRHRDYPLIFIGDGGFNSAESRSYQNILSNVCPFQLAPKTINGKSYPNYPNFRINFGGSGRRVYNTSFTANAFAWCILKAEEIRRANK